MEKNFLDFRFPVTSSIDKTIRLKICNECQLSCKYCHREGSNTSTQITSEHDLNKIMTLGKEMNRNRIHLTGGEPTLNIAIEKIIRTFINNNFEVSITTNGIFCIDTLKRMLDSGLNDFTFSLHSITPEGFVQFNRSKITTSQAERWIYIILSNIAFLLENGINPDINTIVCDRIHQSEIIRKCFYQWNLNVNLLTTVNSSFDNMQEKIRLIRTYDLLPFQYVRAINCSKSRYDFVSNNSFKNRISFLIFEDFYLNSLCENCNKKRIECDEKYYGVRVEKNKNNLLVRPCLNRNLLIPIEGFTNTIIGKEIIKMNNYELVIK